MRTLLFALSISLSFLTYAQNVLTMFEREVIAEDFSNRTNLLPQKYNANELLLVDEGAYLIRRINPEDYSIAYLHHEQVFKAFQMDATIRLSKSKNNAAGLVLHGQEQGNGGIIVEINSECKFRIRKVLNGQEKMLSVSKDGWIKSKKIKKKGENKISVKVNKGYYDIYFNDHFVYSVFDLQFPSGQCGFIVRGGSEMRVAQISVYTEGDALIEMGNTDQGEDSTGQSNENESFQEVILLFKTKIDQQQAEITELQNQLDQCRSMLNYDTTLVAQSQDLLSENERLSFMLDSTSRALISAQDRLAFLESFREDVESGSNGDLVLNLTTILAELKTENQALQQKNKTLSEKNQELNKGNAIMLKEIERLRKLLEAQQN